jgi:hypothetical protein
MRPPIAAELVLFARVLMCLPCRQRGRKAKAILADVAAAERYLLTTGQRHAQFGDGSLMDRCHRLHPCAEPVADDPDFLHALMTVAVALRKHSKL